MLGLGGIGHWVILALVILVLFGRGKVSDLMGDFGKGIKSFKQGLNEEANPQPPAAAPPQIPPAPQSQTTLNGETVVDSTSRPPQ